MAKDDDSRIGVMIGPMFAPGGEPLAVMPLAQLVEVTRMLRDALDKIERGQVRPKKIEALRNALARLESDTAAFGDCLVRVGDLLRDEGVGGETAYGVGVDAGGGADRLDPPGMAESADDFAADLAAYRAAVGSDEEAVPLAVARRLVEGEHPLKVWREHRSLTQKTLAAEAGTSALYLSQIERGQRTGSPKLLRRLADALAVEIDDLVV